MSGEFVLFLGSVVFISMSGVLLPGPMTAAVVRAGARDRLSGAYVSLGHGAVEFPLIILLYLGAGALFESGMVRAWTGLLGGVFMLYMSRGLLRPGRLDLSAHAGRGASFVAGMALSALNPYFLLWWATIGLGLVMSARGFGLWGVAVFALVHWSCDLVWYTFLSAAAGRGIEAFGQGLYKALCIACGLALIGFAAMFIRDAVVALAG